MDDVPDRLIGHGRRRRSVLISSIVLIAAGLLAVGMLGSVGNHMSAAEMSQVDPLPSWNQRESKRTILAFVQAVVSRGGSDYVPPAERIAVFDNDGTLWCEQPQYIQLAFALDRVRALAPQHPEWRTTQPFQSVLENDPKALGTAGVKGLLELVLATHAGMTSDEFDRIAKDWFATARHPRFNRPYSDLAYQPMVELLGYLRANEFKTYIVSGGGIEFMRVISERLYGIPPEQVIGSSGKLKFEVRDGAPVLVRLPELDYFDDKEAKPIAIQKFIGRRPIAAFGNSDGDLQMLQWTAAGAGRRLMLFVDHTDAEREFNYRVSPMGRLERGLDEARQHHWTVVSMKDDWKRVFAFE
jgi:phosphoglycolate phosphatase-like HAD superfamily hydrolase